MQEKRILHTVAGSLTRVAEAKSNVAASVDTPD